MSRKNQEKRDVEKKLDKQRIWERRATLLSQSVVVNPDAPHLRKYPLFSKRLLVFLGVIFFLIQGYDAFCSKHGAASQKLMAKQRPREQIYVELLVAWLKPLNATLTVAKVQK